MKRDFNILKSDISKEISSEDNYQTYNNNQNSIIVGKIDIDKLFSDPFHKVNQDYLGDAHINLDNFRFQFLTLPFFGIYMLYYRTYELFIITALVLGLVKVIIGRFAGGVLSDSLMLIMILGMSVATTELIRYIRVRKSIELKEKGLSDEEIREKLKPSCKPVIICITIIIGLMFLYMLLLVLVAAIFLSTVL